MRIMNMRLYERESKIKAFFDIESEEGFLMKGFKIIDGSKGLFVSNPSEKDNDGKYWDRVRCSAELTDTVSEKALAEYQQMGGGGAPQQPSKESPLPF
jgi:stage V sporulation protein G